MIDDARRRAWRKALILGGSLLLFGLLALRFQAHTVDDAFISFRYARNLVEGHGLVFNPGERVEGYSDFLWVLLLAAGLKLGIAPEITAPLLGLVAGGATVALVAAFSARRFEAALPAAAAPLLLAVHPAFAVWAVGGLETSLFAFLVCWATCRVATDLERGTVAPAGALILVLAALTRPEGAIVAAVLSCVILLHAGFSRRWLLWNLIFLALFGAYFAARWHYYGQLFPNPFYVKVDLGLSQGRRGLIYAHDFGLMTAYWLFPLFAGLAFARSLRAASVFAAVVLILGAEVVYVGGDGLPMHRFFVPILAPLFLLAAFGLEGFLRRFPARRGVRPAAGAVCAAAFFASGLHNFRGADYRYVLQDTREVNAWRAIGLWFRDHAAKDEWIAALPVGAIPWYSGLPTLDMLGLNDLTIAHTPAQLGGGQAGHEKANPAYVLRRRPRYLILGVYRLWADPKQVRILPDYPLERQLLASPEFQSAYSARVARTPEGWFAYFLRNPDAPAR